MSHSIDKQAFAESLLKGILDSGIVKGVDLEADVEVIPGDINTKRLEDGVKKAAEKASKNIGAINVPVDVNQNLSRSDQKKVEKIIDNINKTAFNKNDYRSRKSGTINQGWFDSAVNELKELETTLETLDLDKLQRVAELYAQINGIVSGRYKPKSKIDTSGVDLGFLNKLTSGRIRGRVEDLVGGYVPRSYGRSTGSFAQNVDLSSYKAETDAINTLKQAVDEVTKAVNAKTEAFKNEHDSVQRYVDDEVNALQRLQEKAGQGINLDVTPTYTNQPTTVASPKPKTTVTGRYSWGNEVSVSAVAKGIKDADLKPIINEIERFNQDGSFDPVATLNALKEFKQKIGILSESKSLQEFYDTAVKMKAFNEILGKIKSSNVNTDDKEYKTGYRYFTGQTIKKGEPIPLDVSRLKELSAEAVSAKKTADATIKNAQDELKETAIESQEASQATQQVLASLSDTAKTFLQILQDILFKTEEIRQRANTSNNGKEYATLNDYYDDHPNERPKSKQIPSEELLSIAQATQDIAGYVETIQDVITAKKEEAAAIRESTKQVTEESAASEALEETKEKHAGLLSSMLQAIKEEREKAQAKYADYPADLDFDALDNPYLRDNAQFLVPMEWVKGMASRAVGAIKDRVSGLIKSFVDEFTPALAQRDGLNSDVTSINFKDAVNAQTQALASDTGVAGFQETLNTLTQLETKLSTDIPAAVKIKTEAFAQELKDVTGYIDQETGVLNRFKDDVKDLLSEDQTRSSTEPSFLESELSGIDALKMALDTDIPTAIDVKNQAFKDERDKVIGWVEEEISALGKLDEAAKGVTPPQSPTASDRIGESGNGINGGQNNGSLPIKTGGRRSNNWNLPNRISIFDSIDFEDLDDTGNLSKSVIDALTSILRNAKGQLFNYYDKSRQIATGKFDLNQLSRFYHNALPIRDILDNLGDISWFANMQTTNDKGDTEYINKSLHDVYEAFLNERDAVVDTTAKVLEQGSLIGDISNILYDGSKTLVARMNELARYAMDNAGDIHSAYSQTEREEDALAAIRYLSKNAGKHFKNNALAKSGLLKGGPAANLDLENNEWKYNEQLIRPFINNMDSAQDKVRKKLEGLLRGINHIVNDVVPDTIDSAKAKAADLTANSLENNSPMAKAYRAYGRLSKQDGQNGANYYHTLKKFQDNGMLYGVKNADKLPAAEVNKLLDDQKAKLADIEAKRKEELKLIGAISDEELASNEQLLARKRTYDAVEESAERYAEARFNEAKVKLGQSKYNDSINSIYDAFYRAENFTQKRDTVGITDLEEQELQKAIRNYHELREQLEAIAESSDEAKSALEVLNDKESKASDKLKNKWSDARDRRYGSYLNEGDTKGLYGTRNDVLAGLQRYATREGAKGFQLFDGKAVGNIQKYRAEVENTDGTIEKLNLTLNKTTGELYSVSMGTKQSTSFFEQFSEGLKRRAISLAQYAMTFASLRTAIQAFRAAINNVRDLDSAFVELSRISHDSAAALEEFRKKSFEVADQVGSTAAQVINSAAQWEHLGYNVKEAGELAKVSSIYKNIADGMSSDSEATEDLVAIMKAYDFTAEQAIDVTDALIAVSNNYAVTAADIGNALKRSASAMSVANNTFEQNVALATAMAEVTQNAEKSGSALQVLSLRIRGAKTELQEMGEDTDDMASSTSKLRAQVKGLTKGFDIMADETTFKQTYDIMKGIAAVWDDLDDISRASLLETLAGKVRANQVAALLDNFSQAEKVLQTIAQDEGTAIANNEAKLNTIEARITKFRNATQHLTADIFQPELIKTVIDGGTKIVNLLDSMVQRFGALSPLFAVLGGATTFNGGGIIGGFNEWRAKRRDSKNPITFSDEQIEGITYLKNNGLLTKEKIELLQGYDNKQKDALNLMAEEGLDIADAIKEVGESAQEGGGLFDLFREKGVKAFSAIGMALGNAAISVGIQLALSTAIKLINEFLTVQQRLSESAKSFGNQLKSTNSDLDSYKSKIAEQRAIVEDNKSSIEDVTTARSTLYELQKQMIDAYGIEKDAIKEIADAFDGQTQAIDRNIEKLKERQYQDAVDKYNEENKSIFLPKQKNVLDENGITYTTKEMTPYDYFLEKMEQHQESLYKFANDSNSELQEVYNKHAKKNGWDDPSKVIGHVDQFIDFYDDYLAALDTIYNSLDSQMTENEYRQLKNFASSKRASVKSISEDGSDLYSQELSHQLRTAHSDTYELLNQLYADYTRAKTKETQDEIIHAYSDAINEVKNSGEFSQGLIQALEELHPDLYAQVANWTFEVKIEANEDHLKDSIKTALDNLKSANGGVEVTSDELRDWDKSKHTYEENQAYDNFAGIADTYDISFNELVSQSEKSAGLLSNELRDFNKFLNQSGIDIANFEKRVDTSTLSSTKNLKSKFETALKSVRGNYKNTTDAAVAAWKMVERAEERAADKTKDITGEQLMKIEGDLSKLKNDIFDSKGNVKTTTFKNKDFLAAFDNIPDHVDPAIKALDKFQKVVQTTKDQSKIQKAFDELATSYVYNLDEMKGLTEENALYVEGALSQGGVANAAEVVASALAKSRAETALNTVESELNRQGMLDLSEANSVLSDKTLETINGFVAQTNAADGTQQMLANLLIQQMLLNGSTINTEASQGQLRALAQTAGYAKGEIDALIASMMLQQQMSQMSELKSLGVTGGQMRRYTNVEGEKRAELIQNKREAQIKKSIQKNAELLADVRTTGPASTGSPSDSGSDGSNKEPSKTDKEWDWAARKAELLQRDNDRLREAVNSEYVILQDRKANIVDYNKAMEKLEDVKGQLTAMGVDVEGEEFQNLINTIDLSGAADDITSNVDSIECEYAKIIDLSDEAAVKDFFGVSGEGEGAIDREMQLMAQYAKIMDELAETSDYTSKTLDENGRGKLSIIEDLIESDKQQIEFYKQQKAQYATEAEGYKEEILKAFDDENEALQWIKDVEEGNVNPEKWEQLSTYDSNDQKAKDKYESVDRMLKAKQKEEEADDNIHKKMVQLVEDEQNRFQIQLNIVKAKQEEIQQLVDEAQHELDMKEILGEVVTESDYQHLIDLNDDLIASYREQIDVLREQADELDEGEGAWYDVQSQIRDCESAIRDAVKQQAEWNDTILRMPVENISRFLGLVKNLGQTLKNWLSVNDAKGIAQNAEQIQTSWTTAYDQIADDELGLMKQLEDYEELLENYDLGSTKFSEVDDEIQSARDSVEQLVEEMIELNKQLLTIPIDKLSEMTTYLDGTLSDLQSIQSEYETTINTVIDLITKQQEDLEEEYNELEKSIEDQIKPLQDQLDLLGKQNDQRDRELAIENALFELEKAREQKTVQVIRDGRVQYEVDESAVRNAQQGYDDALYNKLTGDLQDKIDDLNDQLEKARESTDDQVQALEDMKKNRWETIIPDTERARNEEIATQVFTDLFGATNWKELVLAGQDARGVFADEAIYQGMRQSYGTNSEQQRDTQRQIDINNIITESLTRLVEDFQADKINSEELSAKVSTLMNFVNDGLITGQERLENTLSLGDYSNLGAALTDAVRQRDDQMDIFRDNLAIAQENRNQVNELITRWDDFKIWYDETYKQLYEQYKKIDFIGDTVAKWYSDSDDDDGPEYGGVWEGSNHWEEDHYYGGSGDHETGYVTFHDGLEKGSIGSLTPSDKFKAIQALGLKKLDADEFPAILHLGEGVVNRQQQSTMLDNFRSALALGGAGGNSVIQMSFGDITLPSVTNGRDFAESLATQFQPAMNQVFSKIFRR